MYFLVWELNFRYVSLGLGLDFRYMLVGLRVKLYVPVRELNYRYVPLLRPGRAADHTPPSSAAVMEE